MTTNEYDLERPPWSEAGGGTGNSDDWGDEQDRSEWFEAAANYYATLAAGLERSLAAIPRESVRELVNYNWSSERRDFEEWSGHGEPRTEAPVHIFEHMVKIDQWLG